MFLRWKYKNYKRKYEMELMKNTYGLNEGGGIIYIKKFYFVLLCTLS